MLPFQLLQPTALADARAILADATESVLPAAAGIDLLTASYSCKTYHP